MASEREILFRGQTRRLGEKVRMADGAPVEGNWVYGGIFAPSQTGDFAVIYGYDPVEKHSVYRDTVGQYTGLLDKNGERIFEGDILELDGEDGYFLLEYDDDTARFVLDGDGLRVDFDNFYSHNVEVVGNIHDNPELLEVRPE